MQMASWRVSCRTQSAAHAGLQTQGVYSILAVGWKCHRSLPEPPGKPGWHAPAVMWPQEWPTARTVSHDMWVALAPSTAEAAQPLPMQCCAGLGRCHVLTVSGLL